MSTPPEDTITRCVLVSAVTFSSTLVNILLNMDYFVSTYPSILTNPSWPAPDQTCSGDTCEPSPRSFDSSSGTYIFCSAFFFCGLMFHFVRSVFSLEQQDDKKTASYFDRARGQMDAYFLTCFHIHYCASLQYYMYFMSSTGAMPVLGFPSPFRITLGAATSVVPVVRYMTWYNTLPCMCGIPLCLANCNTHEIVKVLGYGMFTIVSGWIAVGGAFEPLFDNSATLRTAWSVLFACGSECCLLGCCVNLHKFMLRTSSMLDAKTSEAAVSVERLPSTSSLPRISKSIGIIWHSFPFVACVVEFGDYFFGADIDGHFLEAVLYGAADVTAKCFCTFAVMMSSFIVGEYATSIVDREKQMAFDMKVKMEEAFVAFVFHEMRNPFNGMAGHIECAESSFEQLQTAIKDKDATTTSQVMKEIKSDLVSLDAAKTHMSSILNRALDLVRSDVGLSVVSQTLSLRTVCKEVMSLAADSRLSSTVEDLRDNAATDGPTLFRGDGLRLKQVLLNLCSNALNHTELAPSDYVKLHVRIENGSKSSKDKEALVHFEVTDSGCGIPKENINNIFTNLFSTRVVKGGIGLGLTISQRLVIAMSGAKSKIQVASPWPPGSDRGSKFDFALRMESVPDDEREVAIGKADIPKGKKAASAFGGKKLDLPKHIRMLVVDDMEMNRKVVIRKLSTLKPFKELEWSFTQAKNGEEALKVLEDEGLDKFDVVWMDEILSLTGGIMLGSETIRIIRGREERKRGRKRSVVVSSTGNTTEKDCALYLDAGADFVAAKPTPGAEELAELFRAAFRKRGYN
ncbi:hypothetical protein TeGR_g4548 [Tetraparma gracilis]|uniref:Histidine kinase n=1 Tax=Tetraparma gracilis TaxID=2962635 RepID=A0ABQ6MPT4_9STRA|nr:hypothetical protein TeGR_g4548 [Tetraparma gracilis]